jgi:hypothetical protein
MTPEPGEVASLIDPDRPFPCEPLHAAHRGEGMTGSPIRLPRTGKPALKTPTTTLLPKPKAGQAISTSLP